MLVSQANVRAADCSLPPPLPSPQPRRGTFEVRAGKGGGKAYVSLTALPRPFKALRELDMDEVCAAAAADLKK